jgi:putative DNA primase/helicase
MSTSEPIDFAAIIEPVARHLLGEPNHKLSNGKQLRFGSQGSVAVEIGGDKKGTWYDHERGKGGGTLDLIGVQKNLIIPDAIRWLEEHSFIPKREKEPTPPKFNIVKRYDYKDANGTLLFRVARLDPKDFRQQAPDGTWKTAHIKKVPYRLPELLAAPLTTNVYIPEGEKDVDALRQQLLVATCNPGGAGKWRQEYNAHFAGRPVIVLSDNDPQAVDTDGKPRFHPDGRPVFPGQDHAAEIANNLKGIAASVRVLMLPNLPPKGDVSDWLAAGGSAEELERLASEALVLEPEPETEPPPTVIDGNWWLGRDLPLRVAVLGEVICASTRMLLSGPTVTVAAASPTNFVRVLR